MADLLDTHQMSKRARHCHSFEEWAAFKHYIIHYHLEQGMTIGQTQSLMKESHGFEASERQYKKKLAEWKVGKNSKTEVMRFLVAKLDQRRKQGKNSVFIVRGREVSIEKLERFRRREMARPSDQPDESIIMETPPLVRVITPSPSRSALAQGRDIGEASRSVTVEPPHTAALHGDLPSEDPYLLDWTLPNTPYQFGYNGTHAATTSTGVIPRSFHHETSPSVWPNGYVCYDNMAYPTQAGSNEAYGYADTQFQYSNWYSSTH